MKSRTHEKEAKQSHDCFFTKNVSSVPQLPDVGRWQGTQVRALGVASEICESGVGVVWPAWRGACEHISSFLSESHSSWHSALIHSNKEGVLRGARWTSF